MRFDNQVALVTAAAGAGIGRACARALAEAGATVVVTDLHEARTHSTAAELQEELGGEVIGLPLDVTDEARVAAVVEEVYERYGRLDIAINNSGYTDQAALWEMSTESWRKTIDISLTGHFFVIRAALQKMREQKSGTIVNIASVAGWMGSLRAEAHYTAAKAGVMGLTRAAAGEAAQFGVRVNGVAPGLAWNEFLGRIYPPDFFDDIVERTPLGRAGTPEDIANAVLFLASDRASFITGEVLTVSGGWYLHA
jgi:3-oxoacyl-[acyl-carrier protein] reductase